MLGIFLAVSPSHSALCCYRSVRRRSTGEEGQQKGWEDRDGAILCYAEMRHLNLSLIKGKRGEEAEEGKSHARHQAKHMHCNSSRGVSGARTPLRLF